MPSNTTKPAQSPLQERLPREKTHPLVAFPQPNGIIKFINCQDMSQNFIRLPPLPPAKHHLAVELDGHADEVGVLLDHALNPGLHHQAPPKEHRGTPRLDLPASDKAHRKVYFSCSRFTAAADCSSRFTAAAGLHSGSVHGSSRFTAAEDFTGATGLLEQ